VIEFNVLRVGCLSEEMFFVDVYLGFSQCLLTLVLVSPKPVCRALEARAAAGQSQQGKTELQFLY